MATKTTSVLTGGSNSHQTSATEINNIATDFIAQGVVGTIGLNTGSGGTGSFAVNAQASPGMSVRVTNGQAYVTGTPTGGTSQTVRVSMDTFEDVTIAANATGGTRYDWIYIKLDPDKMVNPAVDASDVATLVTSRSTSSSVDNGTPPTYGYNLGYVTVSNGASSITNSNITDSRVRTGALTSSTQIPNAAVTASKLATGAATDLIATSQSTSSTTYTDLATVGPTITVTIGANGLALVSLYCADMGSNTVNDRVYMGFGVSGASTVAASDAFALSYQVYANGSHSGASAVFLVSGLAAGSNTFTAKYRASTNTATFINRRIAVVPL